MKKSIFQSLSQRQKKLARNALIETAFLRSVREPSKSELRAIAEQAFKNTAALPKGKAA